ncbi:putative transcriptional regulator [Variibacter gotjawalensis]|nr:putative transcriptional regulator [Variibacter gotjawalensis]
MREGVRLVQERETRLAVLDAALARGLADADAGRIFAAEAFFDQLDGKLKGSSKT